MFKELIARYLVDKNFEEFKHSINENNINDLLDYVNKEIDNLKNYQDGERSNLANMSYDEITALDDIMTGVEYKYTTLIELRHLLNELD
jgi:uncharacterized protein YqeY